MRLVHVITPGDHFSPRTGSAVPTVVDGLSRFAPDGQPRASVAVARGTYADRYDSADIVEYAQAAPLPFRWSKVARYSDALAGRLGLPRLAARREWAATLADQDAWPCSLVVGHNAAQLVPLVNSQRHRPVVYAHNHLLRTYSVAESARVLQEVAVIVSVSHSLADQLASRLPAPLQDRVRVVRNGVDAAAFARPRPPGRRGDLTVMFVGRMIPDKGPDVLVEAVRRLGRPDIRLVLVGSSGFDPRSEPNAFEKSIREAGARLPTPADIRPFVPRNQVADLLHEADVTVVPSRWLDPCPLTVSEGLAAGTAVVASRIGGIPEALGDQGILVNPDDPDELAGALESLLDDEARLVRLAVAGAAYAKAHDWVWASRRLHEVMEAACR